MNVKRRVRRIGRFPRFHTAARRQRATDGHRPRDDPLLTVREAVELVLQASALGVEGPAGESGQIYVLEIGEPVNIMDLARRIIRLAWLRPDNDIEIEVTGLRPGEKLQEELFHEGEALGGTAHSGLRLAAPRTANFELLGRSLNELAELCAYGRGDEVMRLLRHRVPEYQHEPAKDRVSRYCESSISVSSFPDPNPWSFVVFVDEDDAGIFQSILDRLQVLRRS